MTNQNHSDLNVTITALHIYPIKSCGGIALQETIIETYGLRHDRNWVVVEDSDALSPHQSPLKFITQRQLPRMACIQPMLTEHSVQLHAPGMPMLEIPLALQDETRPTRSVNVWRDTLPAWDEGVQAAEWFSTFLGQSLRLMRYATPYQRICDPIWTGTDHAHTRFADGYPILLTNTASLDDLNQRLLEKGAPVIPMNRFRPNIVVSGITAFEEDYVDTFSSTALTLRVVKPCTRCSVPSVDQATGQNTGVEPTATLSTYRLDDSVQGVTFGQNMIVTAGAGSCLRIGQKLDAALNF